MWLRVRPVTHLSNRLPPKNLLNKKYLYHPTERRRPMIAPTDTHHCYPNTAEYYLNRTEQNRTNQNAPNTENPVMEHEIVHWSSQENMLT